MRQRSILPVPQIRQERLQLFERGLTPSARLDPTVLRSWQRCLRIGLETESLGMPADNLSHHALQRQREANHDLLHHSQPVMEYLLDLVSNTQSMVILSDREGVLMHTLGDMDFLGKAERVALMTGASWSEQQRGTNAIGTALAEQTEVEIHGEEHYLVKNGFLTCAAAPILSATGELMGVLDISGDQRSRHPHTLGLVSAAARMIENSLVLSSAADQVLIKIHSQIAGIGSIAQGLLRFSQDGWLTGANRRGLEMLGLQGMQIGSVTWHDLFEVSWSKLLDQHARRSDVPVQLLPLRGAPIWAQLRTRPSLHTVAAKYGRSDTDTDQRWLDAADKAQRVFDKGIPVLITGETGVGKEMLARAMHQRSARHDKPFVAINCAAIPEQLIESELFGYSPGTFTGGARQGAPGRLREAEGGTLFLDEIGDMPIALQTRLLRVLQDRVVSPLGSSQQYPVDFVLICATHHDLQQAVAEGRFRSDLLYRINGLCVKLPALRERTDFDALTRKLLDDLSPATTIVLSDEVQAALRIHGWPGNLRQYNNVLRTAMALLEPSQTIIGWEQLPDDLKAQLGADDRIEQVAVREVYQTYRVVSDQDLSDALQACHGNVSAAAKRLGISRQTMYRRLKWKQKA